MTRRAFEKPERRLAGGRVGTSAAEAALPEPKQGRRAVRAAPRKAQQRRNEVRDVGERRELLRRRCEFDYATRVGMAQMEIPATWP